MAKPKKQTWIRKGWCLLRETYLEYMDSDAFQQGAALAYYTIFAVPPILIIIINIAGALFGREAVTGEIYFQIRGLVGSTAAFEMQKMVENVHTSDSFTFATIISVITFLIGATGVFVAMQSALNMIWGVKPKPKSEYIKLLRDRALSFAMILSIAFLLLVSLVVNALLVALGNFIQQHFSDSLLVILNVVNWVFSLSVISFLFGAIFKFLPDARIEWRDVVVGAIVTGLLFAAGKQLIGLYLGNSDLATVYGAAGSIIIILTWVFYTSQILFFGAQFTLVYSRKYGSNIYPSDYAVRVKRMEVEAGKTPVNAEPGPFEEKEGDAPVHEDPCRSIRPKQQEQKPDEPMKRYGGKRE